MRIAPIDEIKALRQGMIGGVDIPTMIPANGELSVVLGQFYVQTQVEVEVTFLVDQSVFNDPAVTSARFGVEVMPDHAGHSTFIGVSLERNPFAFVESVSLPGGSYLNVPLNVNGTVTKEQRAATCAASCYGDPRCLAWTYFDNRSESCHMKSIFRHSDDFSTDVTAISGLIQSPVFGVIRSSSGSTGSQSDLLGKATLLESAGPGSAWLCTIRAFVDHSIVEGFKDDGLERVTARIYNTQATGGVKAVYRTNQVTGTVQVVSAAAYAMGTVWKDGAITGYNRSAWNMPEPAAHEMMQTPAEDTSSSIAPPASSTFVVMIIAIAVFIAMVRRRQALKSNAYRGTVDKKCTVIEVRVEEV
jgi:hypothetical protein